MMGRSDITFGRQDAVKCPVSVHKLAWQADFPTHKEELGKCILDSISSMHGTGWKSEVKWCEEDKKIENEELAASSILPLPLRLTFLLFQLT